MSCLFVGWLVGLFFTNFLVLCWTCWGSNVAKEVELGVPCRVIYKLQKPPTSADTVAVLFLSFILSFIALWRKPLRKVELRILSKIITFASIFSSSNYFRWKYLDVFSFAISLSICIWVRVENSLLQQLNCQRISCNSNRLRKECESNGRDQLTRALKKWIQIVLLWSR